ncbi:MAG: Ig-like domain-containing protein [Lachnospiraceae bacterium]
MKSSKMFKSMAAVTLSMAMVVPMLAYAPSATQAAKKMSLSAKSALLVTGSTKSVKVKSFTKGAKATWKSSNKKVATVKGKKAKATVKAVSAGTAKISCVVKKGKKKTTVSGLTVKVRQKINSLAMQNTASKATTSTTIKAGEKMVLKASINNSASGSTVNQTVKWSSSNSKVVKVAKKNVNQATITGISEGTATITAIAAPNSKTDKKSVTCTVTVKGETKKDDGKNPGKATATPKPTYPPGVVYQQTKYTVDRPYNNATKNGHAQPGYKLNNFAIWMIGFYDNEFSTSDDDYMAYGPDLTEYKGGPALNVSGQFMYDGADQKTVLLQLNCTQPLDYPMLWMWQDGASKNPPQKVKDAADKFKISGNNGSESVPHGKWTDVNVTFTIPSNAVNGDKDDATGKNFGLYLYFPNKPGGSLLYVSSNTFHFKNFKITEKK